MVKCPRGTPSQIRANLAYARRPEIFSFDSNFFSWVYDPVTGQMVYVGEKEETEVESSESEVECNKDDKIPPATAREEKGSESETKKQQLTVKWDGKPCKKMKLGKVSEKHSEEYAGEDSDLVPCEDSSASSTAEYLKDLYQKRSSNLLKDTNKQKRSLESMETEEMKGEDWESSEGAEPQKEPSLDEEVYFVFLNGVWYNGRAFRRLMDGKGVYFWEDGAVYQGDFESGCVTGTGRLEFPDQSVYEGGTYKAFRHGEGMYYFADSPVMYTGQWWLGQKHGYGLIMYDNPSQKLNFYKGQWQNGVKEGFGFRQYPSGSKYIGFWSGGKRNGKGVMMWNNHDIYRGEWKEGLMHGYGEYTWNGFVNKSLSYPANNTYRGFWSEGKRNGGGVLETKSGATIETVWLDNSKEGPGSVICCNGTVITSECLFRSDKPCSLGDCEDKAGLFFTESSRSRSLTKSKNKSKSDKQLMAYVTSVERAKTISIPIYSSPHRVSLSSFTHMYQSKRKQQMLKEITKSLENDFLMIRLPPKDISGSQELLEKLKKSEPKLTEKDKCLLSNSVAQEEKYLRDAITSNIVSIKRCYDHYATLACDNPPTSKCFLLRLFFWQMLIDGDVPRSNFSLIDIDIILASEECLLIQNPHDPFERFQIWQFIQMLIIVSWHLYGKYVFEDPIVIIDERILEFLDWYQTIEWKRVLKHSFEYLLEKNIFQGRFCVNFKTGQENEKPFDESDLAPMEAMYMVYRSIGEPHSARDFVNVICSKEDEAEDGPDIVKYFERLPKFKIEGKNVMTVAGELFHLPGPEPFNFPQLFGVEQMDPEAEAPMKYFKKLKARRVIKCLVQTCPGIQSEEFIVNMNYQLTFLEFYKAVILCTELSLKMQIMDKLRGEVLKEHAVQMEEYMKAVSEYEKSKEGTTSVSRKKSRQLSDYSKKGRK